MLNYQLVPSAGFELPSDAFHLDVGADGRLYAVGQNAVWVERSPNSREFTKIKSPNFGAPEFIRISPSGRKAAVGSYASNSVYIFELGKTAAARISASSYDAEWFNEQFLAISNQGGDGPEPPSEVVLVDTAQETIRKLITGIPGYSGGVTFDIDGNIYTGIGAAAPAGPATGLIKAFHFDRWKALLSGEAPAIDFTADGRAVANVLSAAFLTFDADWNLCIAGGGGTDAAGDPDMGYAAVISHSGVCAALYDQPPVEPGAPAHILQRLDPNPAEDEYWLLNANPVRKEIYLKKYDSSSVAVYRPRLLRIMTRTDFQLGDNPGHYAGKRFVGMQLSMPIALPSPVDYVGPLCVRLSTSFVQSIAGTHSVKLNNVEIGRLGSGGYSEAWETRDLQVDPERFPALFPLKNPAELAIEVHRGQGAGLADDFVLDSVELVAVPT